VALQIPFFMAPEDEREVMRRLERLQLELWPELTDRQHRAPLCGPRVELVEPAYYLAAGDVVAYPIKRGQHRGRWKIDEVKSPVVYFSRSWMDEEGQLRSGYFWAETETAGDQSRLGGKPSRFLLAVRGLKSTVASTRSGSGASRTPVRNSRISSSTSSAPPPRGSPRRARPCARQGARASWCASTADAAGGVALLMQGSPRAPTPRRAG